MPAIGGAAILVGLAALDWAGFARVGGSAAWIALALAFLLGVADDRTRGGLPPLALLAGQSVVAAALVASEWRICDGDPRVVLAASFLAVVVAVNAVNTFDNADGAATSITIVGLALGPASLAGPLVGFLPFNLPPARRPARARSDRALRAARAPARPRARLLRPDRGGVQALGGRPPAPRPSDAAGRARADRRRVDPGGDGRAGRDRCRRRAARGPRASARSAGLVAPLRDCGSIHAVHRMKRLLLG